MQSPCSDEPQSTEVNVQVDTWLVLVAECNRDANQPDH